MKEWQRRKRRNYRAKKLSLGQCVRCGKPASRDNKRLCERHRIREKIAANLRYHANQAKKKLAASQAVAAQHQPAVTVKALEHDLAFAQRIAGR